MIGGGVPVGDCERAFVTAAAADGVDLVRAKVPWLNQRGHLGLPVSLNVVRDQLERVFVALDGELDDQATKSMTPLPGDFLHVDSGTFIEIDEHQHFTSSRALTLRMYPETASLGFDCTDYVRLCETWAPRSDRYRRDKAARGFGAGGRQR